MRGLSHLTAIFPFFFALAGASLVDRVGAQQPTGDLFRDRTPVMVAVTDSFPYHGAEAVILRRVDFAEHDVILVRRGKAEPRRLAEAVGTMQAVRRRFGDIPTANALIRVQEGGPERRLTAEAANWAQMLSKVQTLDVPGIGKVRYIRLYLPNRT